VSEVLRLVLLLLIAGAGLTALGSLAMWFMEESRRIRRSLRKVLGAEPDAMVVARGRGRGAGFSFFTGRAAVSWDNGAWCLVYGVDDLTGAELIVDGEVTARTYRGEQRRPLDHVGREARQVTLRLVFDDPKNPDFDLDLWLAGDDRGSPAEAVQEANRWLARAEAILRRPRPAPVVQSMPREQPGEDDDDAET
jgi:hypothetical protein